MGHGPLLELESLAKDIAGGIKDKFDGDGVDKDDDGGA